MHPELKTFSRQIPIDDPKEMDNFQKDMDRLHDATHIYIQKLAKDLGIEYLQAADVYYLRSRSRWSQELENQLISLFRDGQTVNICDWP